MLGKELLAELVPEGLKEKFGSAFADLRWLMLCDCACIGLEARADIGRRGPAACDAVSEARAGKVKAGFGRGSMEVMLELDLWL